MELLITAIVIVAALVIGVAWFATKGSDEADEHSDRDNWGT